MTVKLDIDVTELLNYSKRLRSAGRVTKKALAGGINDVGDGLVASIATNVSRETGLSLEQVRGLIKVKRASGTNLNYDITMKEQLADNPSLRRMEGGLESSNFGTREPGQLVVVVTKKDELVCMDCEELEAAGPMPVEIAKEHVPRHPNCRCIILPYVSRRRLPVTMTSLTGTSAGRRSGDVVDQNLTLRQLAQAVLDRAARSIRIELQPRDVG